MKIEKIELNGFKSFAEKTTFNLHSGITCIVGPNGCGKSNIVDAFRWVLGEQSAKTLRGEKMEEVIFNGSASRKPKGMAEVTLAISGLGGSNGNGGGDDRIFTVTRRLYRSGESEYLINRNPCRLKDIKDLFLDTGLEVKSYSIIEQGRIGDILNSKPVERRFLIEEVAGVMKYKVRKAEAQSKLESSRQNLQRITDVVSEVKKQIGTLDRLAKKAERYKALADELKEIDLKINRRDYLLYKKELSEASEKHGRAREAETGLRASLSTVEADYQTRRLEVLQKEKELGGFHEEFQGLERAVADF
ncbi:MAG: AAA family ATPase, partial [Thermodesulfovibrionales bacterium]